MQTTPHARSVLFTPLGFNLAEVTRMIEVASALPPHLTPVFVVHDERYLPLVRQAGFRIEPGGPQLTPAQQAQIMAVDQERGFRLPFTTDLLDARIRAERAASRATNAVVMVHGTNPTAAITARAEGIPLVYPVPYAMSRPHLDSGVTIPVLPASTGAGRLLNPALTAVGGWAFASAPLMPRAFRQAAARHGVPPQRTIAEFFSADHVLFTAMPDEIGGTPLPPGCHRVGPIFAHLDAEIPSLVRELAAGPRPPVYLACGSSGRRSLVLDAVRAVADLPIEVVAPVRSFLTDADLRALPRNVHVVDLLPAHRLGGLIDAAILHGGQGTVQTACATGVPFVGIGLQTEQRWNVAVAQRRGNAIGLAPHQVRSARFRRALHRVLFDPHIRATADQVAREYAEEDGARRSAEIITGLAG